jgi:hypothetical protein
MVNQPILIVGMARSGTTLVSHILGSLPNTHIEVEPHALWKSGNFCYLNDEEFDIKPKIVERIRQKFDVAKDKLFIEKSPINSLRPTLVHEVFPNAKIIYVERNPVRCIYSNYTRSLKKDSFKLSIILKKYFVSTGSEDLPGAVSKRKLFQQISLSDLPCFVGFVAKMFFLRRTSILPFGPKLKGFIDIVKEHGLIGYHVKVFKRSQVHKQKYQTLFGNNFATFKMESVMQDIDEIKKMLDFINVKYEDSWVENIQSSLDADRVKKAMKPSEVDDKIIELLK